MKQFLCLNAWQEMHHTKIDKVEVKKQKKNKEVIRKNNNLIKKTIAKVIKFK